MIKLLKIQTPEIFSIKFVLRKTYKLRLNNFLLIFLDLTKACKPRGQRIITNLLYEGIKHQQKLHRVIMEQMSAFKNEHSSHSTCFFSKKNLLLIHNLYIFLSPYISSSIYPKVCFQLRNCIRACTLKQQKSVGKRAFNTLQHYSLYT